MARKQNEAIDMAIEALEREEKWLNDFENNVPSDIIRREDAVKSVQENIRKWEEVKTETEGAVVRAIINLPSAEAVHGWIPFTRRPMTEEEQEDYPNCTFIFDCDLPDDGDEILVSNGRFVWTDTFCNDIDGCYLDGGDDIDEDMAWMPLPKPYREDGEE